MRLDGANVKKSRAEKLGMIDIHFHAGANPVNTRETAEINESSVYMSIDRSASQTKFAHCINT